MEIIRQLAALIFAIAFAWEVFRDQQNLECFTTWVLALHFIYFQLPLKSRAISFLHPISFVGAFCTAIELSIHFLYKLNFIQNQVELWEISLGAAIIRTALIYCIPLLCHFVDMTIHSSFIVQSYQTKPKKFQMMWSFLSFLAFGFVFEFFYPNNSSSDEQDIQGITPTTFSRLRKLTSVIGSIVALLVLSASILKRAYPQNANQTIRSNHRSKLR